MWSGIQRRLERLGRGSAHPHLRRTWYERLDLSESPWIRFAIAVFAVFAIVWLFPRERTTEYSSWREGMVAPREVIAPFSFNVRKNDVELEHDRALERNRVAPILRATTGLGEERRARLMRFLDALDPALHPESADDPRKLLATADTILVPRDRIHQQTIGWLLAEPAENVPLAREIAPVVMASIYEAGVLPVANAAQVREYFRRRAERFGEEAIPEQVLIVEQDGTERLVPFSRVSGLDEARDNLGQLITRQALSIGQQLSSSSLRALHNLVDAGIEPNLAYDREETIRRQADAASNVALYSRTIFKDERFIESHAVLTAQDIDELNSLADALEQRERNAYRWEPILRWIGRVAIVAGMVLLLGIWCREFHRDIWRRPGWLVLAALLIWLPLVVASYAAANTAVPVFIVPLPLTGMLATVLFGPQVGIILAMAAIVLAGAILGLNFPLVLVNVFTASVAAFSVRHVRNRSQFLGAMVILPVAFIAAIFAADAVQATSATAIWSHIWPGVLNGVAVPVVAMGLLVVFEKVFRITTNLTLLELSDLNSPILRELALHAPGTYTHSLIIANLAENAAEAIDANTLLARVGAYYHDLGKMQRPTHFVENQLYQRNPHDKLSPQMSALIVAAHVKDGMEIGERVGLPKQIIDFIPQHHGTLLIQYFYHRAQQRYGPENVREEAFRYPGPKPQTREAAILMMADAVEAAVRSLKDRTPSRVQGMVHQIIRERLDDGQFDECNLTLRELELVEQSFLPVLAGSLHERVEYPKSVERQAERSIVADSRDGAAPDEEPEPAPMLDTAPEAEPAPEPTAGETKNSR